MANYNIQMNRYNGTSYDALLPKNALNGTTDPTTSTVGIVGQFYTNTTNNTVFVCSAASGTTYTWSILNNPSGLVEASKTVSGIKLNSYPVPVTNRYVAAAYGNNLYIVLNGNSNVYSYGSTITSIQTLGILPTTQDWSSITYGNGLFVMVAKNSNITYYSSDGLNWTQGALPSVQMWSKIIYENSKFIAIATGTNVMAYSTNGTNWTESTMPSSQDWVSIAYGNNLYIAIAQNTNVIATSSDGVSWTSSTISVSSDWIDIAYGNNIFLAVSQSNKIGAYSSDGNSWTSTALPFNATSIAFGNFTGSYYFYIATYGSIYYSNNATTWTQISGAHSGTSKLSLVNTFIICYGEATSFTYITSTTNSGSSFSSALENLMGLGIYANGKYIFTAGINNTYYLSEDGIHWTTHLFPDGNYYYDILYGNNMFVCYQKQSARTYNSVIYSSDGLNWNTATLPSSYTGGFVGKYNNGVFLLASIGNPDSLLYSTDGINWTSTAMPFQISTNVTIEILNNQFVLWSTTSLGLSNDGITWSTYNIPFLGFCIFSSGNKLIAYEVSSTTAHSTFYYSYDGIHWELSNFLKPYALLNWPAYANGMYVIPTNTSGIFLYSLDGINWDEGNYYNNGKDMYISPVNNQFLVSYSTALTNYPIYYLSSPIYDIVLTDMNNNYVCTLRGVY